MAAKKEKFDGIMIGKGDDFFGAVLTCAVRYCLGRRTYMPSLVTDWIRDHCSGQMSGKTLWVMKRDIDERLQAHTEDYRALGDDCDVLTWVKFRQWLEEQEAVK